jgi:hypothetical protein
MHRAQGCRGWQRAGQATAPHAARGSSRRAEAKNLPARCCQPSGRWAVQYLSPSAQAHAAAGSLGVEVSACHRRLWLKSRRLLATGRADTRDVTEVEAIVRGCVEVGENVDGVSVIGCKRSSYTLQYLTCCDTAFLNNLVYRKGACLGEVTASDCGCSKQLQLATLGVLAPKRTSRACFEAMHVRSY